MKNSNLLKLIPVMFTFFIMGYVDSVSISTNYIKNDFNLSDTVAGLLPFMVFLWFLVLSVPTGMLMNRIGRRKTVILSIAISLLAMLVPFAGYSFEVMIISFSLLGIGNTLLQVSLNPLVTNVVSGNRLASSLTLGQFVKAIASFLAPIIAAWGVTKFGDWRMLFLAFSVVAIIPTIWLLLTPIEEKPTERGEVSTFKGCFGLLGDKMILLLFIGIVMHVGIDVGTNLTTPKILIERLGMTLTDAGFAIVLYFICRTVGCFSGAIILTKMSLRNFFIISVGVMVLGTAGLLFFQNLMALYVCIGIMGLGNSNIFSILFSQAMHLKPERNNEVSGLMIMGVAGGGIIPLLMGIASDAVKSQTGAVAVLALCICYLMFMMRRIR